jgi:hypothetical protein
MNTLFPVMLVLLLGGMCGFFLRRLKWPFVLRSCAAALLATVVWCCGSYAYLLALDPREAAGPPIPKLVLLVFLIALLPALWAARAEPPGRVQAGQCSTQSGSCCEESRRPPGSGTA